MSAIEVIRDVAKRRGLEAQHIVGPRRWSELVAARKEIASLMRNAGWSYPRIGRALGNRHHATIMYYLGATIGRGEARAA